MRKFNEIKNYGRGGRQSAVKMELGKTRRKAKAAIDGQTRIGGKRHNSVQRPTTKEMAGRQ